LSESTSPSSPARRDPFLIAADLFDPPRSEQDESPGALAKRLDPLTVQTPALEIIDAELVAVRDAVAMMYRRRERFAALMLAGAGEGEATAATVAEVPPAGNNRLTISMPPQEGKSSRISRYGVLWWLRQFPGLHMAIVSYDRENASRISYLVRSDIELHNGQAGNVDLGLRLARNQKAVGRWTLAAPHSGDVYAIGIGGGITGRPVDLLIIDDPVKDIRAADSLLLSAQAWDWWQTAARPRLAPWAPVIVVATRWHEVDLIGRLLTKHAEDETAGIEHFDRWRVVNIPAQAEAEPDVLGRSPGEFMTSARGRTREQWEATKAATAPRFWTALYQGRPAAEIGEVWLKGWWRRYGEPLWSQRTDGSFHVAEMDSVLQSWDMAFKNKQQSDYVVGQVWAKRRADSFLIYQVWARLSFTDTLDALRRVTRLFPQARRKLVEDKANGTAVIDSLKHEISGIIAVEPRGGKQVRAEAVSPFIRAGNVHLPTPAVASTAAEISWDPESLIVEATAFPNGSHDDQVDATSQALAELYLGAGGQAQLLVPERSGRLRTDRSRPVDRSPVLPGTTQRRLTERQFRNR